MKRILYSVTIFWIITFILLSYADCLDFTKEELDKGMIKISIEKPKTLDNQQFLGVLIHGANVAKGKIYFKKINLYNGKPQYDYYVHFVKSDLSRNIVQDIDTPLYKVDVYSINQIVDFNLSRCNYWISENAVDLFGKMMEKEGIKVTVGLVEKKSSRRLTAKNLAIPALILFLASLFWVIDSERAFSIKKMNGFTYIQIFRGILFKYFIRSFIICGICYCCSLMFALHFMYEYITYTLPKILILIVLTQIPLTIAHLYIFFSGSLNSLKKMNKVETAYFLSLFVKITILIISMSVISQSISEISSLSNNYKFTKRLALKVENYCTLSVNVMNTTINGQNQLEYNSKLDMLYDEILENDFQCIIIDTNNYVGMDESNTLAYKYGQDSITVNEQYFDINQLKNVDGSLFDIKKKIKKGKFNICIPDDRNVDEMVERYTNIYQVDSKELNIVIYPSCNKLETLNINAGRRTNGLIESTVILIYSHKYFGDQMLNYISGEHLIIKCTNESEREKIYSLVKELKLDDILTEVPTIKEVYEMNTSYVLKRFWNVFIQCLLYLVDLVVALFFSTYSYYVIFSKTICVKKISGYCFAERFGIPIMIFVAEAIFFLLINKQYCISPFIVLGEIVVQTLFFFAISAAFERRTLATVLKGE